jgi:hypothetical protein
MHPSTPSHNLRILKWPFGVVREIIRFNHRKGTGKHKIRISKLETNHNNPNTNDRNTQSHVLLGDLILNFESRYIGRF